MMDLVLRETIECYEEDFCYLELSEEWKLQGNSFYYYKFHIPAQKFHIEIVSLEIDPVGPFDCSGPPLWVANISPIALITYGETPPLRIYGMREGRQAIKNYKNYRHMIEDPETCLSAIAKAYPNNERSTPQASLERLVTVHKPSKWSWQEIIELVYENITKAKAVLLDYVNQVPNERVAKVVGDLEITKPIAPR